MNDRAFQDKSAKSYNSLDVISCLAALGWYNGKLGHVPVPADRLLVLKLHGATGGDFFQSQLAEALSKLQAAGHGDSALMQCQLDQITRVLRLCSSCRGHDLVRLKLVLLLLA